MGKVGAVPTTRGNITGIRIGQVFRISSTYSAGPDSYVALTRGRHASCADVQKGVWAYRSIPEPGQTFSRVPAVLLLSNPFKAGSRDTPWVDIIEPDQGYAIYNGDNRKSATPAFQARGNALLAGLQHFYANPGLRKYAPPILLFTQREIGGNRKGYREFSGYGVTVRHMLASHRERKSDQYFTNLVVELALFRLDSEDEGFRLELDRSPSGFPRRCRCCPASGTKRMEAVGPGGTGSP